MLLKTFRKRFSRSRISCSCFVFGVMCSINSLIQGDGEGGRRRKRKRRMMFRVLEGGGGEFVCCWILTSCQPHSVISEAGRQESTYK